MDCILPRTVANFGISKTMIFDTPSDRAMWRVSTSRGYWATTAMPLVLSVGLIYLSLSSSFLPICLEREIQAGMVYK
jgi:hypothetical protein